jgi:pimeloyl-ACP methyl ester carboxylesterase
LKQSPHERNDVNTQVAADHPDIVRRLVLLSTGYRLSDHTRAQMRRIAARIRACAPRHRGRHYWRRDDEAFCLRPIVRRRG